MKIRNLIDRNITAISVLEDTRIISLFLNEQPYLAIIDEEAKTIGIVTLKDLRSNPESRSVIDCNITKVVVDPEQTINEVFYLMKQAESDYLPVYENDNFIGVISLMMITDSLVHTGKETKTLYQKVIHDLRNPLGNLQGLVGILNDTVTDEESQDLIKLCNLSCRHAMDILNDLLFVENDESRPLNKTPTELNDFYKQCINEQLGLSLLKGVQILSNLSEKEFIKEIDRTQIKRAVQNIISNAIKFSHPNSIVKISSKIGGNQLTLMISDAGVGIPINLQPYVFEKSTPAQRPGTNGETSTGLGLYFAKECVEQHGGRVFFASTEGKGTKFYLSL